MEAVADQIPLPTADRPAAPPCRMMTVACLVVGGLLVAGFAWPVPSWRRRLIFAAVAMVLAAVPTTREFLLRLLSRWRTPKPATRRWVAIFVAAIGTIYLLGTAVYQQRDFFPRFHDEHAYMLQARMLAHGELWTAPHELADFFETYHVFVKPVYAPIYFPGCALMHVPAIWLGLPYWLWPAILSGCCAGLMYRVVTELIDGVAGLLAAVMLLALPVFRQISIMVMSHTSMLLLGLAIVWAWLGWRRTRHARWLAFIGAFCGWAMITRPVDSIAWVTPVGLALLYDLRGVAMSTRVRRLAIAAVAALPFFTLQIVFDLGVTGRPLKSPYGHYLDLYSPQNLWYGGDEATKPATTLQQKLDYHEQFTVPAMQAHALSKMPGIWWRERFPQMATVTLPAAVLVILLPLGVIVAVRSLDRAVLVAPPAIFVMLYGPFAYLLLHYIVVHAPGVIVAVLLGRERLAATWPRSRFLALGSTLVIFALTLTSFAELNWWVRDDLYVSPTMQVNYVQIPQTIERPAVVMYRYASGANVHEEPVYNVDVINPDDAEIIRAHDLGPQRNRQLFEYYAKRQPDRTVYQFDRTTWRLSRLGKVADLARNPSTVPASTQP
jgi:hypothetical protein